MGETGEGALKGSFQNLRRGKIILGALLTSPVLNSNLRDFDSEDRG